MHCAIVLVYFVLLGLGLGLHSQKLKTQMYSKSSDIKFLLHFFCVFAFEMSKKRKGLNLFII